MLQAGRTKITCAILAAETGLSIDYIKKLVAEIGGMMAFKKWVLSLYNSYRSSTRFSTPDFLLNQSRIKTWMGLDKTAATKEVLKALNNYGWRDFQQYLDQFSIEIQAEIWAILLPLILPDEVLAWDGSAASDRDVGRRK